MNMRSYENKEENTEPKEPVEQLQTQQTSAPSQGGGILNKLYTKVSGHPTCDVVLNFNPNRKYFSAGDDLIGRVILKTAVEGQNIQHQGIKVSLLGMILQQQAGYTHHKTNESGMIKNFKKETSEITAQNIGQFRQYIFMQIQKEVDSAGDFQDFKEVSFEFKNLDEEFKDHETYNGVDNFIKYFIKVQMTYQGGSIISGNELEKLHEIKVKNHDALKNVKQRMQEIKKNEELEIKEEKSEEQNNSSHFNSVSNLDQESTVALDQTIDQESIRYDDSGFLHNSVPDYDGFNGESPANNMQENQNYDYSNMGGYGNEEVHNAAYSTENYNMNFPEEVEEQKEEQIYSVNPLSGPNNFPMTNIGGSNNQDEDLDDQITF